LLHSGITNLLKKFKELKYKTGYFTNGLALLTLPNIGDVLPLTDTITLSIMSPYNDVQNKFMPNVNPEKILDFLRNNRQATKHIKIMANVLVGKMNIDHLDHLLLALKTAGCSWVTFNGLRPVGISEMASFLVDEFTDTDKKVFLETIARCKRVPLNFKISANLQNILPQSSTAGIVKSKPKKVTKVFAEIIVRCKNMPLTFKTFGKRQNNLPQSLTALTGSIPQSKVTIAEAQRPKKMTINCLEAWRKIFVAMNGSANLCCHVPNSGLGNFFTEQVAYNKIHQEVCAGLLSGEPQHFCKECKFPKTSVDTLHDILKRSNKIE
jgi:hypothetical protein